MSNGDVIAERLLHLGGSAQATIPVRLERPVPDGNDYRCYYSMGWTTGEYRGYAIGIDAFQSIIFALQRIGTEIYTSKAHKEEHLYWLEMGGGFGFLLPDNLSDLREGDDK